ncbi:MAG: response regulator [Anaeromyxobacteraceae bacterium]|nr:response regulator [Anaeromyxobacteraceae bacterium]
MSAGPARRPRLLFVDDERPILNGLRNVLHGDRDRWDLRFALGAAEALRQQEAAPADVVVTDMRMPEVDGLALLRAIQEGWPQATRIVLSGYADLAAVAQASSVAHRYLLKPCDPEVLREVIERALELQQVLGSETLRRTVGAIGTLPSPPRLFLELGEALSDPDVPVRRLAAIVERDVGLSSRVLQFVNSAYFGLARRIAGIEEALVLLGIGTLRHLAMTLEVARAFGAGAAAGAVEELERHALLTARIARRLVADPHRAEAAFAAGLLHDCGKLVLMDRLPGPYAEALAEARSLRRPAHELERARLGADHAEVGAYLLGLWGLPHAIVEGVAFHHSERHLASGTLDTVSAVGAANLLARAGGVAEGRGAEEQARLQRLAQGRLEAWGHLAAGERGGMPGAEEGP